jgi:K+-sensing histidine kinase KdpD
MLSNVRDLTTVRPTRSSVGVGVVAVVSIALGTLVIAALEEATKIPDASAVYLVAVVIVGSLGGTVPAVLTAIASFLLSTTRYSPSHASRWRSPTRASCST